MKITKRSFGGSCSAVFLCSICWSGAGPIFNFKASRTLRTTRNGTWFYLEYTPVFVPIDQFFLGSILNATVFLTRNGQVLRWEGQLLPLQKFLLRVSWVCCCMSGETPTITLYVNFGALWCLRYSVSLKSFVGVVWFPEIMYIMQSRSLSGLWPLLGFS